MLDTPLPPGLKLIRVVPAAQHPIEHPAGLTAALLPTPQLHPSAQTRHCDDMMRLSSPQQRLDNLTQRRSVDDSMIFRSIAGGAAFSKVSIPNAYDYAPPFPKPPSALLASPAFSSLKVDLSSFDHKSDPYYLEKREQILKKFDQESKVASAENTETSFDAKIRSINEQLLELERAPKLVEEALLAADEPALKFSLTAESKEAPPLQPVKPQLKTVSPKPVSTKEDPYDKYNKNPIGNIIGKRALRIKQQLAQKKAEENKSGVGANLEESSTSKENVESSEKVENTDNEALQISTTESIESARSTATENLPVSFKSSRTKEDDDDVIEVSSSNQSEFPHSLNAHFESESLVTGLADSSTDKRELICRTISQSTPLDNDLVDSTTSPDEEKEVNHIVCQNESHIDSESVQQQTSAIEPSRATQLGSEDTNDDSEIEVIRELPPEINDDQILAAFLKEQREAVGRKPQEAASSSQYPWERPTSSVQVTSIKEEPRKISALRRFHADDSSISDQKGVFKRVGLANISEEPSIELHGLTHRGYTSTFNAYLGRMELESNPNYEDVDDDGEQSDSLQKRLLQEAMQAEEEMRNREMAIHPPRRIMTPPSFGESLDSWRNFSAPRSSSSDYIDEELRKLEKQRDLLAAQIEKQKQLNEEKKRQKILEFKKREEVRKRLREEFEKKREQDRQALLAERKKFIALKQKEEEERRRKLEEERREAERRERERKERERLEKLRREKAEKELNASITEMIRQDLKNEFISSVKNDGTGITKLKSTAIPEAVCICFENFEPSFDRVNALMKKKCFAKMPLNEDYIVGDVVSNFDDELIIPDIDVAILSVKEYRMQRKMENFITILQKLPDNYLQEPDETEFILDNDLPHYKDSDESSDEEVKSMADKIREECQKSREAQKVAREKARKAAEEAAKLEAEQKAKREAARAEKERLQMERNRLMKQRAMESQAAERNRKTASYQDSAPLSISTVVRRDPDDPGRINYEPEKRKTSSLMQAANQHSGLCSPDKRYSSSHPRGSAAGMGMGSSFPVKVKQEIPEPSLAIPIPPPSMFPPVIAPDASVVYNAAAASFAATYFPNYKLVNDFMDDRGPTQEGVAPPDDRRSRNRSNNSPPDKRRHRQETESFSNSNYSPVVARSRAANRSRSRSFSSSDFKPPAPRKRPNSQSSTDSFSSSESRSRSPNRRSTARKRRKVKTKKRRDSSKKLKKKSRKHGREKRKYRRGDEKLRKRKKLKKRKKMMDSDQPDVDGTNESLMPNDKIFINPHHQNFKAIQKKYSSSNVISPDIPRDFSIIKHEPLSPESSYDSFSD